MAWLQDLFGKKAAATKAGIAPEAEATAPGADVACSFCDLPRSSVKKLIAGPKGTFLCETCVADCVAVLEDQDFHDPVDSTQDFVLRQLRGLGKRINLAASRRLVEAGLALAAGDPAACRALCSVAVSVHDPVSAALALAGIREPERTIDDRVDEALLHDMAGATETALTHLEALDASTFTAEHRLIVPLHRATLRLAAGLVDRDEARAFDARADEVLAALPAFALTETYIRDLHREVLLGRARAARVLGDLDRTLALLEPHVAVAPDGEAWALLYEVHASCGRRSEALAARTRALEATYPESSLANRLRSQDL